MKAIVYTSNTGSTKKYAELLSECISIPTYSLEKASSALQQGDEIIYLGWLMASGVKGLKKVVAKYKVVAVCGVGMCETGTMEDEIRKSNQIDKEIPLFTLQGGFDINKLHGIYKLMMKLIIKKFSKDISVKENKTPQEKDMLDMMINGGSRVGKDNLKNVLEWYNNQN